MSDRGACRYDSDCCDKLDKVLVEIGEIRMLLQGNPATGTPGLRLEVDRLKETESRRAWTLRTVYVAVVGLVARAIYNTFYK